MIVQIYEIQTPSEALKCIEMGVDHIGSVLLSGAEWQVPSIKEAASHICVGAPHMLWSDYCFSDRNELA
ncbi:hypothetical protein PITCH_A500008 [uncultured Desulfobacterium sp.]|uniref:Uncharacterized protein n=1 Tax=uncultured Desulfobacterium sp. TaxID=201089 RepID=A0A445N0K5_9BACT|nr:hypothetical protein PITCH_A500008 [uncultured Desulfobacterium sp.]